MHSSSQYVARTILTDTTLSVRHTRQLPGNSATLSSRVPNSAFERRRAMTRACSASPGLRRPLSLLGISVAQHRAQLAEQVAESSMSSVGRIADETHCTREVGEAAIAEVRSMHGEVQSKVTLLTARANASTAHAIKVLSGCIQEVADVRVSCLLTAPQPRGALVVANVSETAYRRQLLADTSVAAGACPTDQWRW